MPSQQGLDHAGLTLERISLNFALSLQRPQRLGNRQYMVRR